MPMYSVIAPKFLVFRFPKALRNAPFLDVEFNGNGTIAPVHAVVLNDVPVSMEAHVYAREHNGRVHNKSVK